MKGEGLCKWTRHSLPQKVSVSGLLKLDIKKGTSCALSAVVVCYPAAAVSLLPWLLDPACIAAFEHPLQLRSLHALQTSCAAILLAEQSQVLS